MKRVFWNWTGMVLLLAICLKPASSFAQSSTAGKSGEESKGSSAAKKRSVQANEGVNKNEMRAPSAKQKSSKKSSRKPTPASAPRAAATSSEGVDGATYQIRLRDLEQRVDELKEQIRRSHTRLSLLSDTILSGASGGGRAEIEFRNELSGAWHVVEAVFVLDGAVQYKKSDDSGALAKQRRIPIFSGTIPAGDHTLQVMLKLRGHGFGVFSYLRGLEAKVTSDHSFTLSEGKVLELSATAWEQGGPTTPVEEQPAIRFQQTIRGVGDRPRTAPKKQPVPASETKGTRAKAPKIEAGAKK